MNCQAPNPSSFSKPASLHPSDDPNHQRPSLSASQTQTVEPHCIASSSSRCNSDSAPHLLIATPSLLLHSSVTQIDVNPSFNVDFELETRRLLYWLACASLPSTQHPPLNRSDQINPGPHSNASKVASPPLSCEHSSELQEPRHHDERFSPFSPFFFRADLCLRTKGDDLLKLLEWI